jgi:hypothetical protein
MDLLHRGPLPLHRVCEANYMGLGFKEGLFFPCKQAITVLGSGKYEVRIVLGHTTYTTCTASKAPPSPKQRRGVHTRRAERGVGQYFGRRET